MEYIQGQGFRRRQLKVILEKQSPSVDTKIEIVENKQTNKTYLEDIEKFIETGKSYKHIEDN